MTRRDYQASIDGSAPRCLLLLPPGHDAPLDLLDGLRQRNVTVRELHDAPAVMAALATPDAADKSGRVVVIAEPLALREADALVEAIRRYHRRVVVWNYQAARRPALQPWPSAQNQPAADDSAAHGPTTESTPPPAASGQTPPAPEASASSPPHAETAPDVEPPLLTEEELTMLLNDEPPTQQRGSS